MKLHRLPALLPLLASSLSAGSLLWAASAQAATEPADDAADAKTGQASKSRDIMRFIEIFPKCFIEKVLLTSGRLKTSLVKAA